MCCKNVKNIKFLPSDVFFQAPNAPKTVFGRGNLLRGTYDAPPDPLVDWGGCTSSPY